MHRFFLPPGSLVEGATVALDAHAHQIDAVLRLQPGDAVVLLDGSGLEHPATLTEVAPRRAAARVGAGRPCPTEPRVQITLYLCTLKGEKFEWVLQKGTELGVAAFVPVISRRSIVRPAAAVDGKAARWRSVIREAAEQAHRARLPRLAPALEYAQAVAQAQGVRLLAWEEAGGTAPPLPALSGRDAAGVSLLVGPEGGLEPSEAAEAQAVGWQVVSLGPRILRAETAALAGVAALLALAGEMGGATEETH